MRSLMLWTGLLVWTVTGHWLCTVAAAMAPGPVQDTVEIRIVGPGGGAKYLGPEKTVQEPVRVQVGDSVVWINQSNTVHTATSTAEDESQRPRFGTGDIRTGQKSQPVPITRALFEALGGTAGQELAADYYCDYHSSMGSSLIIEDPVPEDGPALVRQAAADLWVRRDIEAVQRDPAALQQYRDAWRRIQLDGSFARLAGNHGCPDHWCHRPGEGATFIAWHREYLHRLERALGQPLHYWNWTSETAIASGIPAAFTDSVYLSADGNTYPNPLRSFRYSCPPGNPPQSTVRSPSPPFLLGGLLADVERAYAARSYLDFNSRAEVPPHNAIHGWIGGHMGSVPTAAYDPVFWAHHANVDRQWASWQRLGGPDPDAATGAMPLTGFSGRRVADTLSTAALGYTYDRFDSGTFPALRESFAMRSRAFRQSTSDQGVGKTFRLAQRMRATARDAGPAELDLFVSGPGEHPAGSGVVFVFVNQPDATVEDAHPGNPNFAGFFGLFGGGPEAGGDGHRVAAADEWRRAARLFAGRGPVRADQIESVTLVMTDPFGSVVTAAEIPVAAADLRRADDDGNVPADDAANVRGGGMRATAEDLIVAGESQSNSWDEAWQSAVTRAKAGLRRRGAAEGGMQIEFRSAETTVFPDGLQRLRIEVRAVPK